MVGVLGLAAVVLVAARPSIGPTITWTPPAVMETIAVGGPSVTVSVSFTAAESLSQVSVRVVPELAPYVQVMPSSFGSMVAGQPIALTLTLAAATTAQPGLVQGTIQLRSDDGSTGRTLAKPLPVTLELTTAGNIAPVAAAGPDQTVFVGDTVHLDGRASSDLEGDVLTFHWSVHAVPAGSRATLSDPTATQPTFVVDRPGTYTVQLLVNDGQVDSAPDTVGISTQNSPPRANAGSDQTVRVGDQVHLDGSASSDVDGEALTFQWAFTFTPVDSLATLKDPTAVHPWFMVDRPGTYIAQLIVNDGAVESAPDTVTISTENSRPVANAGPDQAVPVGETVRLNGSASSDADGDPLSFWWSLSAVPLGSAAMLSDPAIAQPTFVVDRPGIYVGQLIVNDGTVDSVPDAVVISTENSRPVANAGLDQAVPVGATVQLDGSASSDADQDVLGFRWALTTVPEGSAAVLSNPTAVQSTFVADVPGTYVAQLIVNDGVLDSAPDAVVILAVDTRPPDLRLTPPDSTVLNTAAPLLTVTYSDEASGVDLASLQVLLDGVDATHLFTVTATSASSQATLANGPHRLAASLRDHAGNAAQATAQFTIDTVPPDAVNPAILTVEPVMNGQVTVTGAAGSVEPQAQVRLTNTRTGQAVTVTATASGGFTATLLAQPGDALTLTVLDAAGHSSPPTTATVGGAVPPDPATVAPPVDPGVATDLATATAFLYTGSPAIQTGVASGTIHPLRVAVLRGQVTDRSGAPLVGVTLTVRHHPEYGQTLSRADGLFDLAVNGGGILTVNYAKSGYLPAQRQVHAPWQDFAWLPEVALVPLDTQMTPITLSPGAPPQVARGSVVTDSAGTRQATVLFPAGTLAEQVFPDGSTQPLSTLHVRATEYTVGPNGPQAMPAALPPTSAYTYAVEFSVDEALTTGATAVRFSQPVITYVENFLGFPVGTMVPVGFYEQAQAAWIPAASGRVVQILRVTGGMADLDIDGDGLADGGAALAALAITDAERQRLAGLYPPGQSLWRALIPHFTPWDLNWPFGPPPDAVVPPDDPEPDEPLDDACTQAGNSIIECQNQILGEALGVVGTGFGLHYQSERVPGRKVAYTVDIPLSSSQVPASLRQIELEISVAGRLFRQRFAPAPNQRTTFTWDGRNAYGQVLQGRQPIAARIGYTYGGVYGATSSFGVPGLILVTGVESRQEVTLWRLWRGLVGVWDARGNGLGGWTPSPQHSYDPVDQVLYRGDGLRQSARALGPTISTVAGTGTSVSGCHPGDGGPATQADVCPQGLAVGPDGSLYIASPAANRVRRVAPDGIITTVAGTGFGCASATGPCGDGGLATQAQLSGPWSVAVGPDTSLYIGEAGRRVVRRVGPDGIITTIAGTGVPGDSGDGGPATLAQISTALSLAVGPDTSVYIADAPNRRIRRVGPDGIIITVAGTGVSGFSGDGGPATLARLGDPRGVAVGQDGSLYIADTSAQRVRRVTPDGIIRTIAGTGVSGFSGDGGPATEARFNTPYAVAIGQDDTVYVVDQGNHRVRWLRPDGTINTLAGSGDGGTSGDGGLARQAALQNLETGLAVGPDGSVYVSQTANNVRVRRIVPLAERLRVGGVGGLAVPAADGSELYLFTASGRHVRTLAGLTGALRFEFAYESGGRLAAVTDGNGNITTVERDSAGGPMAMVGPFGQRTTLAINPDGYLNRITSPAGEAVQLAYTADGLLTGLTTPRGHLSRYAYDALGRLTSATDPTGAVKTLARAGTTKDSTVTLTSALGRATTYRVERLSTGDVRRTTIDPAGAQIQAVIGKDGAETVTYPDGTTVHVVLGPDPRWGMQAPLAALVTVTTPGGRVQTTTTERTATLTDPGNPLSLRTLSETVTVNGRAFTTAYDAPSRTFTHTAPTGRQASAIVDDRGRLTQEEFGGLDPSSYTYDARGRLATVTQGQGAASRTTALTYGGDGFLESITDAIGRATAFTSDANGRITAQIFPDGERARFAYDANANVSALAPPGRPDHTFSYTARDQVSVYAAPTAGAENNQTGYRYDADRGPIQVDRPDGQSVGFVYDSAGRVSQVDLASDDRSYGYDAAGRLSILSTPTIALTYAYDGELPTVTTWSGAITGSVTWSYDTNFQVSSHSVNGSNPIALQYNQDGLLTQVGDLTLTRNAPSGLITSTALGAIRDATTYDGFGAQASYTASHGGSAVYAAVYTRDALGRITSTTETSGGATHVTSYTYDLARRLSEVREDGVLTASYTYDANGNRLSRTTPAGTIDATYDVQDRLIQYGSTTYAYSPNGELLSKTAGGQTTTYAYNGLGNLTAVTLPGGTQVEYLLDGADRRVGKRINGTLGQGFLYQSGLRPIAELDGAGNVVSRFIYGTRVNVPEYIIKSGAIYRIISDHLGSPRLIMNTSDGTVAQRLDYDEYGNVLLDSNPGFQPFGFAGGLYDPLTGLVHFGAREYAPDAGRWTTKDPIWFGGGDGNLYAYIMNDPINGVDPSGLDPFEYFDDFRVALIDAAEFIWKNYRSDAKDFYGFLYQNAQGKKDAKGLYFYIPPLKGKKKGGLPPKELFLAACKVGEAKGAFFYFVEPHRQRSRTRIGVLQLKEPGRFASIEGTWQVTTIEELEKSLDNK
jgi:RHS repeat-associated protein